MSKVKVLDVETMNGKTVAELRELCRKYKITGVGKARKDEIIEALEQYFEDNTDSYDSSSDKTSKTSGASKDGKVPYINANVHSFLGNDNTYKSLISVSCGAASSNYPVVGRTVGFVKATYREILNINTDAASVVNGNNTPDSYVLKSGDVLEFVRQAGSKG